MIVNNGNEMKCNETKKKKYGKRIFSKIFCRKEVIWKDYIYMCVCMFNLSLSFVVIVV